MRTTIAGPKGAFNAGSIVPVTAAEARDLVAGGYAEPTAELPPTEPVIDVDQDEDEEEEDHGQEDEAPSSDDFPAGIAAAVADAVSELVVQSVTQPAPVQAAQPTSRFAARRKKPQS